MNFYQVNQRNTLQREFSGGYLCAPDANRGGWRLMQQLRAGDVLFHYCSVAHFPGISGRGAVLGISRVKNAGQHKGASMSTARLIQGTQCLQYVGAHLSAEDFEAPLREHYQSEYSSYLEVHIHPLMKVNLPRIVPRSPLAYLFRLDGAAARDFLSKHGIDVADLALVASSSK